MMSGFTVEYSPAYRPRRRIRYEPHDDGDGYWRIIEEWDGDQWCVERRETITDVAYEVDADRLYSEPVG